VAVIWGLASQVQRLPGYARFKSCKAAGLDGCLTMPGLKAARFRGWRAVWFLAGLKADCVLGWIAIWLPSDLKTDRVPGYYTTVKINLHYD